MPSATYSYDGGIPGSCVATITGATVGNKYYLCCRAPSGSSFTGPITAPSSSFTITSTTSPGGGWTAGDRFVVFCEDDGPAGTDFTPFDPVLMTAGTAGSGHANDAGLAATWNPS